MRSCLLKQLSPLAVFAAKDDVARIDEQKAFQLRRPKSARIASGLYGYRINTMALAKRSGLDGLPMGQPQPQRTADRFAVNLQSQPHLSSENEAELPRRSNKLPRFWTRPAKAIARNVCLAVASCRFVRAAHTAKRHEEGDDLLRGCALCGAVCNLFLRPDP